MFLFIPFPSPLFLSSFPLHYPCHDDDPARKCGSGQRSKGEHGAKARKGSDEGREKKEEDEISFFPPFMACRSPFWFGRRRMKVAADRSIHPSSAFDEAGGGKGGERLVDGCLSSGAKRCRVPLSPACLNSRRVPRITPSSCPFSCSVPSHR
ncbi:hypothetical protein IE53DRAFT_391319 [Violaceomyces palustris]|uniref:Uncharacterized protein n=1 Tax=Violaceomyces palustris TaxID=1673888 RepID=A0ACD0NL11_9BASI|nr:hypothetical protein IE53DRAFT_391319 [Violaceomyces palustris]